MLDEVATLFRDLRRVLGKSAVEIAAELGAPTQAIVALEHGHLALMPPWPETARIVRDYTGMAGIDPRPALIVLEAAFAQYEASLSAVAKQAEGKIAQAEWVNEPQASFSLLKPQPEWPQPPAPDYASSDRWPPDQTGAPADRPASQPYSEPLSRLKSYGHIEQQDTHAPPNSQPLSAGLPATVQPSPAAGGNGDNTGGARPPAGPSWRKGRSGMPVPAPATVNQKQSAPDHDGHGEDRGVDEEQSAMSRLAAGFSRQHSVFSLPPARTAIIAALAAGMPLVLTVALTQSTVVSAAAAHLPGPVASIIRNSHDFLVHQFATTREGMRWIDVDEPRARRTDKLPTRGQ